MLSIASIFYFTERKKFDFKENLQTIINDTKRSASFRECQVRRSHVSESMIMKQRFLYFVKKTIHAILTLEISEYQNFSKWILHSLIVDLNFKMLF